MSELYHYGRKGMKWYQHIFKDDDPKLSSYDRLLRASRRASQDDVFPSTRGKTGLNRRKYRALESVFEKSQKEHYSDEDFSNARSRYNKAEKAVRFHPISDFFTKKYTKELTSSRAEYNQAIEIARELISRDMLTEVSKLPKKYRDAGARFVIFALNGD